MSFGFSVGDFIAVLKLTEQVYKAYRDGPTEYQEICREARSLNYAIEELSRDARDPDSLLNRKGGRRKKELEDIIENVQCSMQELLDIIEKRSSLSNGSDEKRKKTKSNAGSGSGIVSGGSNAIRRTWDSYALGSTDLESLRGKLNFHTSAISVFLLSLEGPAIGRIERKLDRIYERLATQDIALRNAHQSTLSVASSASIISQIETNEEDAWLVLKKELLTDGISMAHVLANKEEIIRHVKSLVEGETKNLEASSLFDGESVYDKEQIYQRNAQLPLLQRSATAPSRRAAIPSTQLPPVGENVKVISKSLANPIMVTEKSSSTGNVEATISKLVFGNWYWEGACVLGIDLEFPSSSTNDSNSYDISFFRRSADSPFPKVTAVRSTYAQPAVSDGNRDSKTHDPRNRSIVRWEHGAVLSGSQNYSSDAQWLVKVANLGRAGMSCSKIHIEGNPFYGQDVPSVVRLCLVILHDHAPFMAAFRPRTHFDSGKTSIDEEGDIHVIFRPGIEDAVITPEIVEDYVLQLKNRHSQGCGLRDCNIMTIEP